VWFAASTLLIRFSSSEFKGLCLSPPHAFSTLTGMAILEGLPASPRTLATVTRAIRVTAPIAGLPLLEGEAAVEVEKRVQLTLAVRVAMVGLGLQRTLLQEAIRANPMQAYSVREAVEVVEQPQEEPEEPEEPLSRARIRTFPLMVHGMDTRASLLLNWALEAAEAAEAETASLVPLERAVRAVLVEGASEARLETLTTAERFARMGPPEATAPVLQQLLTRAVEAAVEAAVEVASTCFVRM
jgi:hypothetical protein